MIEKELTSAASLLIDFSDEAITARRQKHRDTYERKCLEEGEHLPAERELKRWYPGTKPTVMS